MVQPMWSPQQYKTWPTPSENLFVIGVPNRTSYELHLPAEMSACYWALVLQRTLSGRGPLERLQGQSRVGGVVLDEQNVDRLVRKAHAASSF
jgi:hypothetical protein